MIGDLMSDVAFNQSFLFFSRSKSLDMSSSKDQDKDNSVSTKNLTEDDDPWKLPDLEIDTVAWPGECCEFFRSL